VLQILERVQGFLDHGMRGFAPQLRHQGDTAGIVLM
jgi:hypothetical protein